MKLSAATRPSNYGRLLRMAYAALMHPRGTQDGLLSAIRNRHYGKRCFIIGNGPSLRTEDLERLRPEYSFGSNKIFLGYNETTWRPTFYSVEDYLVARQNRKAIRSLTGSLKFFPFYCDSFFLPVRDAIYYRLTFLQEGDPAYPWFGDDAVKRGFCFGYTVIYSQMQLAWHMGFRQLYLLGTDFSYDYESKSKTHEELVGRGEKNHFHKDYRKAGEKWNKPNMKMMLLAMDHAEAASRRMGFRIFNATRGGKLEAFERVDFDSLF